MIVCIKFHQGNIEKFYSLGKNFNKMVEPGDMGQWISVLNVMFPVVAEICH